MKRFIELLKSKTSLVISSTIVGMATLNVVLSIGSSLETAVGTTIGLGVIALFPMVLALQKK